MLVKENARRQQNDKPRKKVNSKQANYGLLETEEACKQGTCKKARAIAQIASLHTALKGTR